MEFYKVFQKFKATSECSDTDDDEYESDDSLDWFSGILQPILKPNEPTNSDIGNGCIAMNVRKSAIDLNGSAFFAKLNQHLYRNLVIPSNLINDLSQMNEDELLEYFTRLPDDQKLRKTQALQTIKENRQTKYQTQLNEIKLILEKSEAQHRLQLIAKSNFVDKFDLSIYPDLDSKVSAIKELEKQFIETKDAIKEANNCSKK